MALTQSAVSRQIQSLEDEVACPCSWYTRAVELTQRRRAIAAVGAVGAAAHRRRGKGRSARARAADGGAHDLRVLASMWFIPRLEAFQRDNPDIDIRIDASDSAVDLDVADVDLALRYGPGRKACRRGRCGSSASTTPVAKPWLLKSNPPIRKPGGHRALHADRSRRCAPHPPGGSPGGAGSR